MKIPKYKVACSRIGIIMTGTVGLSEAQETALSGLVEKSTTDKGLTTKQGEAMEALIFKKQNPELPQTVKSSLNLWLMQKIYKRRKEIKSKYMEKGHIMEDDALDMVAKHLGVALLQKNVEFFEDDFFRGEPDGLPDNGLVVDTKCSWDFSTFPLIDQKIENEDYWWQLQGYMRLTGRKKASLVYCLLDTPMHLIEREARFHCLNNGYEPNDESILKGFVKKMTYDDIPDKLKYKSFEIERDDDAISRVIERVKLCRIYIKETLKTIKY